MWNGAKNLLLNLVFSLNDAKGKLYTDSAFAPERCPDDILKIYKISNLSRKWTELKLTLKYYG